MEARQKEVKEVLTAEEATGFAGLPWRLVGGQTGALPRRLWEAYRDGPEPDQKELLDRAAKQFVERGGYA